MPESLRKIKPGDPLRVPATAINTIIDLKTAMNQRFGSLGLPPFASSPTNILVKNTSGADVARFGILGIDSILFLPNDNLTTFHNQPCLTCIEPTVLHTGKFVVLLEPIRDNEIGLAAIAGVTAVQVARGNIVDEWADVTDGDATILTSGPIGTAKILYPIAGEGDTGTQWALVQLGLSPPEIYVIKVTGFTSPSTLGGGKYWGRVQKRTATAYAKTGNLSAASMYQDASTTDVIVVNYLEISTHNITGNSIHFCRAAGMTADSVVVYEMITAGITFACPG